MKNAYALVNRDGTDTGKRKVFMKPPLGANDIAPHKPYWVPYIETTNDNSNGAQYTVVSDWETVINKDGQGRVINITRRRSIRPESPTERKNRRDRIVDNRYDNEGLDRGLMQYLRFLENRVRQLEGQPSIGVNEFKDIIKTWMN